MSSRVNVYSPRPIPAVLAEKRFVIPLHRVVNPIWWIMIVCVGFSSPTTHQAAKVEPFKTFAVAEFTCARQFGKVHCYFFFGPFFFISDGIIGLNSSSVGYSGVFSGSLGAIVVFGFFSDLLVFFGSSSTDVMKYDTYWLSGTSNTSPGLYD